MSKLKDSLFATTSKTALEIKQPMAPTHNDTIHHIHRKRTANAADKFRIGKLLEENLSPKDSDGCVTYLNNMTDEKIARMLGPNISPASVAHIRLKVFGNMRKPYFNSTLESRVIRLEEMFNKLSEEAGSDLRINVVSE